MHPDNKKMITLAGLCKNAFFLRGIEPLLKENNIRVADVFSNPKEALQRLKSAGADILLMDGHWRQSGDSGMAILRQLLEKHKNIRVIIVTSFPEDQLMARYQDAGASGYFYRTVNNIEQIVACIKVVYEDRTLLLPSAQYSQEEA